MKSAAELSERAMLSARSRLLDFVELMKPELTGLSVLTTLCGYYLASTVGFQMDEFLLLSLATLLVGGGIGALNQYIERRYDALMKRTERRPLPSGRLSPDVVLVYGSTTTLVGVAMLALVFNVLTVAIALTIIVSYLFVYTPLKRHTWLSTLIGGIPGALPPVMGWTAAANEVSWGAIALFAILFFWQMPHFYALAWMYKKDYARAGYPMLSVLDESGKRTSWQNFVFTLALVPACIGLTVAGTTTLLFAVLSIGITLVFAAYTFRMVHETRREHPTQVVINVASRRIFFASLWYLPILMMFMVMDRAS
jgi:protoheme IX farnesyltransferase